MFQALSLAASLGWSSVAVAMPPGKDSSQSHILVVERGNGRSDFVRFL